MKLRYFRYRLPFIHPFHTGNCTWHKREGIIIQLQRNRITAWGEAAPLPDRSPEDLYQIIDQLKTHAPALNRLFQDELVPGCLDHFFQQYDIAPSLCFALDSLVCEYAAQSKSMSLSHLLYENPMSLIPLNIVIPIQHEIDAMRAAVRADREGYKTFKIKMGRNFSKELSLLKTLRNQFRNTKLRIDANRAWKFDEALDNLDRLKDLDIEYCEEPIRQPTPSALEVLSKQSPIPLALDETLTDFATIREVAPFIPVLILKPMILGKFSDLFATKRLLDTHEHKAVFTTSLESGVGRRMTAILAAGLGSQNVAHGLATGSLLAVDIWRDGSYIQKGYFSLSGNSDMAREVQSNLEYAAEEIII